ncbi:MAG: GPW/gp25 family protein [Kofleriaceae bacterium]
MAREFLGTGLRFPLLPDATGALGFSSGDANVEQSLHLLLMTAEGERLMRANLGTEAERMVFAPGGERYLRLLETTVQEAVRDWESRVDLIDVRAEIDAADATRVLVSIAYRVRQTNTRHSLVFPFYVGRAEGT